MALQKIVKIASHRRVKGNYCKLSFDYRALAKESLPGQFIHIRISKAFEPLLRRPFSIHRVSRGKAEVLYEVVGKGTEMLSQKKIGESLDIVGPLGNGFNLLAKTYELNPILVAGGMGVAPLIFLAEKLAETRNPKSKIRTTVLIGAKTKDHLLCAKEFKALGCDVKIATDDGSRGFKGKVTELLKDTLRRTKDEGRRMIYACGPKSMLKEIKEICLRKNISCQASFEENIACGLGACLGCAINTKSGLKRVCYDGPVFDVKEVEI